MIPQNDKSILSAAKDLLLSGHVVAIPTETVYGLAARIDSEAGLRKIFSLKKRPFFDPLIVHVASFKQASQLVEEWPPLADFLARTFWPGPLTLVLKKAEHVNRLITSGLDTVAIRFPLHPLAQELIQLSDCPLAAPSANQFGHTSPSTAEHVRNEFPNESLTIIDGGPCSVGIESTVVTIEAPTEMTAVTCLRILRPGGVSAESLAKALLKFSHPVRIEAAESAASPGHLLHHYMPSLPLVIIADTEADGLSGGLSKEGTGRLTAAVGQSVAKRPVELKLDSDPTIAARELYSDMRRLAESGASVIYIKSSADRSGLWSAIWDRLSRAATVTLLSEPES